jgi:DNA-binding NarL/FixJ family response regulator
MTTRVLLCDDQALVRSGFRMIIEARPGLEVAGEAEDGIQAVQLARETEPDVILMDVRMPRQDGIEATRQIVAVGIRSRILVLTTYDLDEYVYAALQAGASGFLLKDARPAQLADAIRVIADGEALLAPSITRRLLSRFTRTQPNQQVKTPASLSALTGRETEVLRLLASGLSNAELASRLFVSEATIKSHISSLLRKLGVRDRVQAVILVYETRLILPGPNHPTWHNSKPGSSVGAHGQGAREAGG